MKKAEEDLEIFIIYYKWPPCLFNCKQYLYYNLLCLFYVIKRMWKELIFVVCSLNIFSMKFDRFFCCIQHILSQIDDRVMCDSLTMLATWKKTSWNNSRFPMCSHYYCCRSYFFHFQPRFFSPHTAISLSACASIYILLGSLCLYETFVCIM